jgi:hypothetical protein
VLKRLSRLLVCSLVILLAVLSRSKVGMGRPLVKLGRLFV